MLSNTTVQAVTAESEELSGGLIAAIVVPTVAVVALLLAGGAFAYYKHQKTSMPRASTGKPVPVEMLVEAPTEVKGVELKFGESNI